MPFRLIFVSVCPIFVALCKVLDILASIFVDKIYVQVAVMTVLSAELMHSTFRLYVPYGDVEHSTHLSQSPGAFSSSDKQVQRQNVVLLQYYNALVSASLSLCTLLCVYGREGSS